MAVVSHWTGDNTALDSVGSNDGTLVSGTTYGSGQIGQGFSFDGIDDRVQVADSESLKLTNSLTIEAWVRADAITPSGGVILFRGDDRGGLDPYSLSTTQKGALQFQVSSLTQGANVTTPMPLGQFEHVVGTLDDATGDMRLYINGVLMSQGVTSVRPFRDLDPASNPSIGIGNHGGYPATPHNFPFKGLIDELKIYDNALTGDDVLALFNARKGSLQPVVSVGDTITMEGDTRVRYLGNAVDMQSGGLDQPYGLAYGPDGNLYVSMIGSGGVLRYDATAPLPAPGKPGAEFVTPRAGGLTSARELAFGPDGNLYVVSELTNAVLRFDASTGEPLGELVAAGAGGVSLPRGLLFHTDGYLYVTSVGTTTPGAGQDSILRFNAVTGAPAGLSGLPSDAVFVSSGTAGLDNPSQIVFHNGDFYVSSTAQTATANSVLRFGTDGSSKGALVTSGSGGLWGPVDLGFHDGYLYLTSWTNNKVLRYNGTTGAFVDEVVSGEGLSRAFGMLFESSGSFLVASAETDEIRRYGASDDAVFTISLSAPFPTTFSASYATAGGSTLAGADYLATAGTLTFEPGQTVKTVIVPVISDGIVEPDETFTLDLSYDGQTTSGIGTIIDFGSELRVNSTTAGSQVTTLLPINYNPLTTQQAVASDSAGNFVVVWTGNGVGDVDGVFFQRYGSNGAARGGETRANVATANAQTNAVVGRASSNGRYVIAWNSNNGVYGRVFNANGTAASGEITISAGSSSTKNYIDSIAVDADGDFVVLYKQLVTKGFSESLYWQVQRYNATGAAQNSAIRVTTLNLINGVGGMASDANGNFVVVWDDGGVNAQRYSNSGKKVGSQISVSAYGGGNVGRDADGDFVVTWVRQSVDATNQPTFEHYAQVFDNGGAKRGGAVKLQDSSSSLPASIAVQADGDFVLTWTNSTSQTGNDVNARPFDLNGIPQAAAVRVNPLTSGEQEFPSVAVADNGDYVVTWNTPIYQSNAPSAPTLLDSDVRARRFMAPAAQTAGLSNSGEAGPSSNAERFDIALLLMLEEDAVGVKKRKSPAAVVKH